MIGAVLVILSTAILGYQGKLALKKKVDMTQEIINGLKILREEIRLRPNFLHQNIKKCNFSDFFNNVSQKLNEGKSAEIAWEESTLILSSDFPELAEIISDITFQIGKTDTDGQVSLFDGTISQLEEHILKEKEILKEKGDMYLKLGAVSGILVAILLF